MSALSGPWRNYAERVFPTVILGPGESTVIIPARVGIKVYVCAIYYPGNENPGDLSIGSMSTLGGSLELLRFKGQAWAVRSDTSYITESTTGGEITLANEHASETFRIMFNYFYRRIERFSE